MRPIPPYFASAAAIASFVVLSSCTAIDTGTTSSSSATYAEDSSSQPTSAPDASKDSPQATRHRVDIPIPEESVLPLLEAEFALRAGQFSRALEILGEQSQELTDPDLVRRTLRLAEFLRDQEQSLAAALRLSDLVPSDGSAAATAMALLARRGEVVRSLEYAQRARAAGSRINAPLLVTGLGSLSASDRAAVTETITTLAEQWPEDSDIAIALALLHREMLDLASAEAVLEQVLAREPSEERTLILWTQVALDRSAKNPFDRLAAAVTKSPDNERLRLQYARLLASNERYDEAREQFASLVDASPRNDEYLMALALIDLELESFDAAADTLNVMLGLEQRVDEVNYYLGRSHEGAGRPDAAFDAYQRVGPGREFADAKRRAARLITDEPDGAAAFFAQQRDAFPDVAERLFLIEAELARENSDAAAIRIYSGALAAFPTSMSLQYGRAMIYEAIGNIDAMEQDLRSILSRDPNNATTLNALGYTLTNHTTRFEEAVQLIERALELSPGDAAMLDSLGWVYFKMGRINEAETILRDAYRLLPDPEVAAHLGEVLWTAGKQLEARDAWRAGLAADPASTAVLTTLQRLGVTLD